jgi:hypothetical protein
MDFSQHMAYFKSNKLNNFVNIVNGYYSLEMSEIK